MRRTRKPLRNLALAWAGLGLLALAGCRSIGPATIERERLDYSLAISESVKTQALLNLVKLRYLDTPVFLDVSQIVSSDSLETSVGMEGVYQFFGVHAWDHATLNAGSRYTNRPTVTFSPLTGDRFVRAMMEPVLPARILSLVEAGYDAQFVLETCVNAINGLHNRSVLAGQARPADADFGRLMRAISRVQASGGIGFRIERTGKEDPVCVTVFRQPGADPQAEIAAREVKASWDWTRRWTASSSSAATPLAPRDS